MRGGGGERGGVGGCGRKGRSGKTGEKEEGKGDLSTNTWGFWVFDFFDLFRKGKRHIKNKTYRFYFYICMYLCSQKDKMHSTKELFSYEKWKN